MCSSCTRQVIKTRNSPQNRPSSSSRGFTEIRYPRATREAAINDPVNLINVYHKNRSWLRLELDFISL